MNENKEIVIDKEYSGMMLKKYLSEILGYSRRMITRLHFEKAIEINNESIGLTRILNENDLLVIKLAGKEASKGKIEILYEDNHLLIVNKPAGLACHPSAEHSNDNLVSILERQEKGKFYPVGRLDKNVSGIMLFGKSSEIAGKLNKARDKGKQNKYYRCIVNKKWEKEKGTIVKKLKKDTNSHLFVESDDGKECITEYLLIDYQNNHSELEIHLKTGRTHQIRATLATEGFPICGDIQYGGSKELGRVGLHAYRLEFIHPETKERIKIICPIERDMARLLLK